MNFFPQYNSFLKYTSIFLFVISLILILVGRVHLSAPSLILVISILAIFFMGKHSLNNFSFTISIFVFVFLSVFYPSSFGEWLGIEPLIQIIIFGMGSTLNIGDLVGIYSSNYGLEVVTGVILFSTFQGVVESHGKLVALTINFSI